MIKVYIASPYTVGDPAVNVKRQIDVTDILLNHGFSPYTPLYSHFQHMVHPRSYEDWMKLDLDWIDVCDCLLRLDGESPGADTETEYAESIGLLIFYSIEELVKFYKKVEEL